MGINLTQSTLFIQALVTFKCFLSVLASFYVYLTQGMGHVERQTLHQENVSTGQACLHMFVGRFLH